MVKGHLNWHQLLITFNAECLAFDKEQRDAKRLRTAGDGSDPSLENAENDVMTATDTKKGGLEEMMFETRCYKYGRRSGRNLCRTSQPRCR